MTLLIISDSMQYDIISSALWISTESASNLPMHGAAYQDTQCHDNYYYDYKQLVRHACNYNVHV